MSVPPQQTAPSLETKIKDTERAIAALKLEKEQTKKELEKDKLSWIDASNSKKRKFEEDKQINLGNLRKDFMKTKMNDHETLEKQEPIFI